MAVRALKVYARTRTVLGLLWKAHEKRWYCSRTANFHGTSQQSGAGAVEGVATTLIPVL